MSSPGQRRGKCGHVMANFDTHSHCARCRDNGKGKEPCVSDPQTSNCQICNSLTSDQRHQLATPSYKLKKEKCEAKLTDPTPSQDSDQLVDLSSVSVIWVVDEQGSVKSPASVPPPDKKPKKDNKNSKKEKSPSTKASKHSTDTEDKFSELDNKWSKHFSRQEALIMAKSFEPTFSSKVKVTPTHSPPHDVENVSEPFIRPSTSKLTESSQISSWNTDASELNSSYSRIAKYTGLSPTPPASRRISQETLRRWERSARETSVICNQAASFNRCLFKIQQNMKDQLKILKAENKGKDSTKASTAAEELNYLMDFNSSITQAAAKSMEHLSEFVFITMGNLTLVHRDAYLNHLRTGIKPDTLTALRTAPLHISTLFPDSGIKRAEEDIAGASQSKGRYHPYERQDKRSVNRDSRSDKPAWKTIGREQFRRGRGRTTTFSS